MTTEGKGLMIHTSTTRSNRGRSYSGNRLLENSVSSIYSNKLTFMYLNLAHLSRYMDPLSTQWSGATHPFTVVNIVARINTDDYIISRGYPF